MFEERDHVHTLLYHYQWEHRREPDGVRWNSLDHPYPGFVTTFIDRADDISNEEFWSWLRNEHLPALMPGSDADLVAAFMPVALEVDAPGDVPRRRPATTARCCSGSSTHRPRWLGSRSSPSTGASWRPPARER